MWPFKKNIERKQFKDVAYKEEELQCTRYTLELMTKEGDKFVFEADEEFYQNTSDLSYYSEPRVDDYIFLFNLKNKMNNDLFQNTIENPTKVFVGVPQSIIILSKEVIKKKFNVAYIRTTVEY